jgi:hypothetical protein
MAGEPLKEGGRQAEALQAVSRLEEPQEPRSRGEAPWAAVLHTP